MCIKWIIYIIYILCINIIYYIMMIDDDDDDDDDIIVIYACTKIRENKN